MSAFQTVKTKCIPQHLLILDDLNLCACSRNLQTENSLRVKPGSHSIGEMVSDNVCELKIYMVGLDVSDEVKYAVH